MSAKRFRFWMMFACLAALVLTALPAAAHTATDVPAQAQDGAVPDGFTYIVQRGDTLAILAARYHTTVAAIVRANGLTNPNLIYAGQILYIPAPPQPACGATYIVRYGDTLARIARRCGTTVQALAIANNIYNINLIFAGQVLVITTHVPPPPPPPPTLIITYYVQPGDFIARIAARFGTTANAIIAYNRLTHPNLIYPGQILYIPVYS